MNIYIYVCVICIYYACILYMTTIHVWGNFYVETPKHSISKVFFCSKPHFQDVQLDCPRPKFLAPFGEPHNPPGEMLKPGTCLLAALLQQMISKDRI